MSRAPVVIAPSFPRRADASDGQSVYVVEAAHALAARRGTTLRALALRLGDEPAFERDGRIEITRIEPALPIAGPFALYEAAHFERVMTQLAREAERRLPADAPALVHGYEMGEVAAALAARGHRVVAVLHYLLAQESEHYLASADDPFRREVMPRAIARVAALCPPGQRANVVRLATGMADLARGGAGRVAERAADRVGAAVAVHQLRKLAMERALVSSADVSVGVSAGLAAAIRRFHPRAKVAWCHAGRPEDVAAAPWEPSTRLRLLAVGRPTPQKGWDVLAHALARLERERPALADRIELTLVGGTGAWAGPHSAFGERTRRALLALERVRVHDAGRLARRQVMPHYGAADVLVLPSDYEPFGLVVLEAMSAGCPVLAFDTDGPRDLIVEGAGFLVRAGDWPGRAARLAHAITRLEGLDANAWRAHRRAARARAEQFSWDRTAEALEGWLSATAPRR